MPLLLLLLAALATTALGYMGICDGLDIYNASSMLLQSRHVVVCEIDYPPFAMSSTRLESMQAGGYEIPDSAPMKDGWTGMDIAMLERFSLELGFTYEIKGQAKTEEDGTWANTLTRILPECDMVGTYWTHTAKRREEMLFMSGHIDYSGSMIVRSNEHAETPLENKLYTFFLPFSVGAWFSLAGMTIASGIVMFLLEVTSDASSLNLRNQLYQSVAQCLWGGFSSPARATSVPYQMVNGFIVLILVSACTSARLRIEGRPLA